MTQRQPGVWTVSKAEVGLLRAIFGSPDLVVKKSQQNRLTGAVAYAVSTLTERECRVILLRFGLEDGRRRPLLEVAKEFGVTRERIRQIEAKALRMLRHPSRSKSLREMADPASMAVW